MTIGLLIYFMFQGFHLIDPQENIFPMIRTKSIPYWVKYNLADGLWLYSYMATISIIWKVDNSFSLYAWIIIALLSAFLMETLQSYHVVPGTFDWYDLLAYIIFASLFFFTYQIIFFNIYQKSK